MGRFLLVLHLEKFDQFACAALGSGRPFLPSLKEHFCPHQV
jgi:hypothetical protein